MSDEGIEKGAILLLSLGEEGATEVFKHLGPREVQKLGLAMSNLKDVTRDKVENVLSSFRTRAEEKTSLGLNSGEYLRSVLTNALGDDKAGNLIDRLRLGYVVDFISIGTLPVLNLADASLITGIAILVVVVWLRQRHEKEQPEVTETPG